MASNKEYVDSVIEALAPLNVRARAMFGEYGFYCDDKVCGFICDDQVLLKPLNLPITGLAVLPMAEAYPGSKLYHLIPNEQLDSDWFREAVQATANAQPAKKPKAAKKK